MKMKSLKIPLSTISVRDRAIILELLKFRFVHFPNPKMMHHVGNKMSPGEYLRTMSAINICKMTFKDAKLKQKSHFNILSCFGARLRRKSILGSLGSGTQ